MGTLDARGLRGLSNRWFALLLFAIPLLVLAGYASMKWFVLPAGDPQVFTNSLGMRFVRIPAGEFWMGSPPDEAERSSDEVRHRVSLTKPFWLGMTEVTQAEWKLVMGKAPSHSRGEDHPVEGVLWADAEAFCKRLSRDEGRRYRLPTEAEWEYACRAGTETPFNTGETIGTDHANFDGSETYGKGIKGMVRGGTTPVGIFPPNGWGLHDMHGGVWEWCGPPPGETSGPTSGTVRVLRGGSWSDGPRFLSSARRYKNPPGYWRNRYGFRCALDL